LVTDDHVDNKQRSKLEAENNKMHHTSAQRDPVKTIPPLAFGYLLSDTVSVTDEWNMPDFAMVSAVTVASK